MELKNYCIIAFSNIELVVYDIIKLAENVPNVLCTGDLLMSTFSSALKTGEITDYFKLSNVDFVLFDLDDKNSGYNVMDSKVREHLFGFLTRKEIKKQENNNEKINLKTLTQKEKTELLNSILDKGVNNLSKSDKELLDKLVKAS